MCYGPYQHTSQWLSNILLCHCVIFLTIQLLDSITCLVFQHEINTQNKMDTYITLLGRIISSGSQVNKKGPFSLHLLCILYCRTAFQNSLHRHLFWGHYVLDTALPSGLKASFPIYLPSSSCPVPIPPFCCDWCGVRLTFPLGRGKTWQLEHKGFGKAWSSLSCLEKDR